MGINKKKLLLAIFFFIISIAFINNLLIAVEFADVANAKELVLGGLEDTGKGIGYDTGKETKDIPDYIGNIINAVLAFIGVIFMVLIWMGAFDLIGAGGNEEIVKKGKLKIKNGAIGIVIVFAAYLLAKVILSLAIGGDAPIFKI